MVPFCSCPRMAEPLAVPHGLGPSRPSRRQQAGEPSGGLCMDLRVCEHARVQVCGCEVRVWMRCACVRWDMYVWMGYARVHGCKCEVCVWMGYARVHGCKCEVRVWMGYACVHVCKCEVRVWKRCACVRWGMHVWMGYACVHECKCEVRVWMRSWGDLYNRVGGRAWEAKA